MGKYIIAGNWKMNKLPSETYDYVKEVVEKAVQQATELPIRFEEGIISRLDVYRSLTLPSDQDCRNVIAWLQKQPTIGKYKRQGKGRPVYRLALDQPLTLRL